LKDLQGMTAAAAALIDAANGPFWDIAMTAVYTLLAFVVFLAALNIVEKGRID
jgi:hypothetical protein